MLLFDKETHTYTLEGVELTSVTTLIKDVGIINDRFYTPEGTMRGTNVHTATELLDRGTLDWSTVTEEIEPYLEAWIKFKEDYKPNIQLIEQLMYHPLLNYAGCMDRAVEIEGVPWILDLKSGASARWHQIQLTLYGMMIEGIKPRLAAVYLKKTGKYQFKEYEWDEKTAMSIVRVNQWKRG